MEPYSDNPFVNQERIDQSMRHVVIRFSAQALGVEFNWALNQEVLFSSALTGKPSNIGRDQIKPAAECLRGVATYTKGDMIQGRYSMALIDLRNCSYGQAVVAGYESFNIDRANNEVACLT